MDDAKKQLIDKLKSANNVLVTVSRDPSVDQLAALIGFTLLLNKDGKHAAAVFSGKIPSTIDFLKPDETIEKTTDSLQDFIIALDKNKADKLRYKVEDNVVRIFITPFRTSITKDDFEFSQGDLNVDLIVAIGVKVQTDLDEAIVAHGRILHDATIATINMSADGGLGAVNWHEPGASSLSELVTRLGQELDDKLFDEQIATALLTGIVAETDRFSNEKTSPDTMSASARLMSAGANQQLVASNLQEGGALASINVQQADANTAPGTLAIDHGAPEPEAGPAPAADLPTFDLPAPSVDSLPSEAEELDDGDDDSEDVESTSAEIMTEAPTMGSASTAATATSIGTEPIEASPDPLGVPSQNPPMLQHDITPLASGLNGALTAPPLPAEPESQVQPPADLMAQMTPPPPAWTPPQVDSAEVEVKSPDQTLTELEEAVASPHLEKADVSDARDAVSSALNDPAVTEPPVAQQSTGAVQLGAELHPSDLPSDPSTPEIPQTSVPPASNPGQTPPPVPPPMPMPFGNQPPPQ